jgi:hypothetical protein
VTTSIKGLIDRKARKHAKYMKEFYDSKPEEELTYLSAKLGTIRVLGDLKATTIKRPMLPKKEEGQKEQQ